MCKNASESAEATVVEPKADVDLPPPTAPQKLSLKEPISAKQGLQNGWDAGSESKAAFYLREVLLGIIICMAQIPESIAFALRVRTFQDSPASPPMMF